MLKCWFQALWGPKSGGDLWSTRSTPEWQPCCTHIAPLSCVQADGLGQTDRETSVWSPSPPRHRSSRGRDVAPQYGEGWRRATEVTRTAGGPVCSPVEGVMTKGQEWEGGGTFCMGTPVAEMPSSKPGCPLSALALKEPTRTQTLMCGGNLKLIDTLLHSLENWLLNKINLSNREAKSLTHISGSKPCHTVLSIKLC